MTGPPVHRRWSASTDASDIVSDYSIGRAIGGFAGLAGGPALSDAGAVIGGALGGIYGAYQVASRKKEMPRVSASNQAVNRSTMVVKGKTKTKQVKTVKVSPAFRKAVKQVITAKESQGTYMTINCGLVGNVVSNNTSVINVTDLGVAQVGLLVSPSLAQAGARTMWGCLGTWAPAANTTLVPESGLNFFTPAKILDAASVLFNDKPLGDPYIQTGNLSTVNVTTTAIPVPSISGPLKIHVINSFVQFKMKNVSNRVVSMDIWECTPTIKFMQAPPLYNLYETVRKYSTTGNDTSVLYFSGGATRSEIYHEAAVDPLAVAKEYMGFQWTWKKRSMQLAPDETCLHSIQGPQNTVLDYSKINTQNTAGAITEQFNCLMKGYSVGCIISVHGDQVLDPTIAGWRGQDVGYHVNDTARLSAPVAIEYKEVIKVGVPEVAGFKTSAGVAGTQQMLNNRKPVLTIRNLKPNNGVNTTFEVGNEENPLMDVAGAQDQ